MSVLQKYEFADQRHYCAVYRLVRYDLWLDCLAGFAIERNTEDCEIIGSSHPSCKSTKAAFKVRPKWHNPMLEQMQTPYHTVLKSREGLNWEAGVARLIH